MALIGGIYPVYKYFIFKMPGNKMKFHKHPSLFTRDH